MYIRTLLSIVIISQILIGQQIGESKLKCSRSTTAKAFIDNYSALTASQSNYDAIYYDIDIEIDPAEQKIYGTVGVYGKSLVSNLDIVDLDLYSGLTVNSVKNASGDELSFTHDNNILSVALNTMVNNNSFEIMVVYEGQPQSSGLGSFNFDQFNLKPMIWSLSEPYGARAWWPCKDTPNDKADSLDISIKVPSDLIAASNGKLVNTEVNGNWTTYHWQERYPIATYLVSVAIHPYRFFDDWYVNSVNDSMRLEFYVFHEHYETVKPTYDLTNDMMVAMADIFGEYPFINEKYGHAEMNRGGGMEHQTLTSLGGYSEGLIAHELGHQWWGDMVTCANFHHIWLNEGFATYSEALWYEKRDNDIQSLHNEMAANRNYYFIFPEGRRKSSDSEIYVKDTSSVSRIFDSSITYAKSSWILHMLRHIVGDDNFFNGIKEYGERYRFKSAVTEQFQNVMEEISGKDLDYFFERWIYGEFYPIYDVTYSYSADSLFVLIDQIQDSDVFEMPIDIKAHFSDNTEKTWIVHNNQRRQLFTIPFSNNKTIQNLQIDPDEWILRKIAGIKFDSTDKLMIPSGFKLYPVYPNPFNGEANIRFYIEEEGIVEVNIYNINGTRVWHQKQFYSDGTHSLKWYGSNDFGDKLPSGAYIAEAKANGKIQLQKLSFLK